MSAERPLLVSSSLIGPILRGKKTVTRRLLPAVFNSPPSLIAQWHPPGTWSRMHPAGAPDYAWGAGWRGTYPSIVRCPFGAVGDVLWVRETWRAIEQDDGADGVLFPDGSFCPIANTAEAADAWMAAYSNGKWGTGWRPSIRMPRWAARIFLRVESVTVERVQDITEEGARAEGVIEAYDGVFDDANYCARAKAMGAVVGDARPTFALVWDSLAPAGSKWADNPWVWMIRFKLEAR